MAGLLRPEAGTLTVLGGSPRAAVSAGQVGYMTQAPALYGELSVNENLRFFAALQGLPHPDDRIAEALAGTLNLVGALSGVAVAKTVGNRIVDANVVTQDLVVAALISLRTVWCPRARVSSSRIGSR